MGEKTFDLTVSLYDLTPHQVAEIRQAVLGVLHPTSDITWMVEEKSGSETVLVTHD